MLHIAIDLGGRQSQFCSRNSDGSIVEEGLVPTRQLGDWLSEQPKARVILETCTEAFAVADAGLAHGHDVRVVPSHIVRKLGVGYRRTKNDRRDARALSESSCQTNLRSVHIRSHLSRELQAAQRMRESLVAVRTKLINGVRAYLRGRLVRIRSGNVTTFGCRVREACLDSEHGIPDYVERNLAALDALNEQIKAADLELRGLVKKSDVCCRLMTTPGVGPLTALRFVSAVDKVERFADAHSLESFLGLTPGEKSSSGRTRRLGITKAGPGDLRGLLVQSAWCAWNYRRSDPMVMWASGVAARRGQKVAIVALSRKIAGVMYALWRDGSRYESSRLQREAA